MRKPKQNDRFVPPLMQAFRSSFREKDSTKQLDLRDESEQRIIAGRQSSPRNAVHERVLRAELAADLDALVNTVNLEASIDLDDFPEVQKSILNFGMPDLSALTMESSEANLVGQQLEQALKNFESRLLGESIAVSGEVQQDEVGSRLAFKIKADMHATPSDVPIEFLADFEAFSGQGKLRGI